MHGSLILQAVEPYTYCDLN